MSKIAQYLNEHILGEVVSNESTLKQFSRDGSILSINPEIVVHPRLTNDIRKIARFTWQLAEKGHIMPITTRGGGSDKTGAAIGKGIIINTSAHLKNIIFINLKDKDQFVHVQPGVSFNTLNETLKSHGVYVPTYPSSGAYSTVGGAIANNTGGALSGQYGLTGDWVKRLEVVLANGDIIETNRINKHDLNKKKGLQTLEGEIYRKIDGIIDDNQQIIADKNNNHDNTGYPGISKVKGRDGSFDLTPLFIGSQGTLGIISEAVLKTDFYSSEELIMVASFNSPELARDAADSLISLKPVILEIIDGEFYKIAKTHGKKYLFDDINSILYISFNDFSAKVRHHKMKLTLKKLSKLDTTVYTSENHSIEELRAIREVSSVILQSETRDESYPPLIDGASIPAERREEFIAAVDELSKKHHITMPLQIRWLDGVINTRSAFQLHNIADKQKVFKLINDYADIVSKFDGNFLAESCEGRLKTISAYGLIDDDVIDIYTQIRAIFDPLGTMNPGVKQMTDIKTLVSELNPSFNLDDFAKYSPVN